MDICVSWMVSGPDLMGSDPNEQMMLTFTSSIIITSLLLLQDTIRCYFKTSLSMSNTRLWLLSSGSFKLFSNPTSYLSTQRQTSLILSNQEKNFLSSVPSYCQSQSVLQHKIIYWNVQIWVINISSWRPFEPLDFIPRAIRRSGHVTHATLIG